MAELRQISVFAENKPGKIEKITKVLADEGINILAISIASSGDFGAIKFIVDKSDEAYLGLKERGFTVSRNNVLGIELQDRPGSIHGAVEALGRCGVNVENAHVFVVESRHRAFLIVEVEDVQVAKDALKEEDLRFYE